MKPGRAPMKALVVAGALTGLVAGVASPAVAAASPKSGDWVVSAPDGSVVRNGGANRYETAVKLSQWYSPGVKTVYVATGATYPDALAAAGPAGMEQAPVLLTEPNKLPVAVANRVKQLKPGRVLIMGGPGAVSPGVEAKLKGLVPNAGSVQRVAGSDRFETAADLARKTFPKGAKTVFLVSGLDFPDALVAAPAAQSKDAAVLMVARDQMPGPTADVLRQFKPEKVYAVGGPGVVSDNVLNQAVKISGASNKQRLGGANRFETSSKVTLTFFKDAKFQNNAESQAAAELKAAKAELKSAQDQLKKAQQTTDDLSYMTDAQYMQLIEGLTMAWINEYRKQAGLRPLLYSDEIAEGAHKWSKKMADSYNGQRITFFQHSKAGDPVYRKHKWGGENILYYGGSYYDSLAHKSLANALEIAKTLGDGWQHSEGHNKNFLANEPAVAGMGVDWRVVDGPNGPAPMICATYQHAQMFQLKDDGTYYKIPDAYWMESVQDTTGINMSQHVKYDPLVPGSKVDRSNNDTIKKQQSTVKRTGNVIKGYKKPAPDPTKVAQAKVAVATAQAKVDQAQAKLGQAQANKVDLKAEVNALVKQGKTVGEATRTVNWKHYGHGAHLAVVANGMDFPDALVGAAVAGADDGPVILTLPNELSAETKQALSATPHRVALVTGGPAVVSPAVQNQVAKVSNLRVVE